MVLSHVNYNNVAITMLTANECFPVILHAYILFK